METAYNGIGELAATFKTSGAVTAGIPVKISASGTVAPCLAGDVPAGIASSVSQGFACVSVSGFATVSYSGTAPAAGYTQLAADGNGGMKAVASNGKFYQTVCIDTAAKTVVILL